MVLIATAKASNANSYATVAEANDIARQRLYTDVWDNASSTPDASGYLVNGAVTAGTTTIAVDGGSGTFTAGSIVEFSSHSTEYTVSTALTGAGNLVISPGLVQGLEDDEQISLQTASQKAKALMFATRLLDEQVIWNGTRRTLDQALQWPRSGVTDEDGDFFDFDTIPQLLKVVTFELALVLLGRDVFSRPAILGEGFDEVALGPISIKVSDRQRIDVIPQNIISILSPLGRIEPEAKHGTKVVPLRRT